MKLSKEQSTLVLDVIRARRSVRKYRPDPIPGELLDAVLDAGRHAPSGGNNQTTHILVIQNQARLEELKALVIAEFAKMEVSENTYKSMANSIRAAKTGTYNFYFNAPTLVLVANKQGYGNAMADCSCVLENMMLAATALELGSCWVNQLRWLDTNESVHAYLEALGLGKDEIVCGALSLGYPDGAEPQPLERQGNPVTYVR